MKALTAELSVGELMTSEPIAVTVETPLAEVAEVLARHRISGVPVLDSAGELAGVISQTDLLRARAIENLWSSWPGLSARHLMSHPAITVSPDASLEDASHLMEEHRVHRLVVVEHGTRRPIGIISVSDLMHSMAAHHG